MTYFFGKDVLTASYLKRFLEDNYNNQRRANGIPKSIIPKAIFTAWIKNKLSVIGEIITSVPMRRTACSMSAEVISPVSFFWSSSMTWSRKKNLIAFKIKLNRSPEKKLISPPFCFNVERSSIPTWSYFFSSSEREMFFWNFGMRLITYYLEYPPGESLRQKIHDVCL